LCERRQIIRKHNHQIASSRLSNGVAPNTHPRYTRAILHSPRGQNNPVWAIRFSRTSFHRDTSIAKVGGEFHDHVRACKRKEECESICSTVPVPPFYHRSYFRFSVNNVLPLEYSKSGT